MHTDQPLLVQGRADWMAGAGFGLMVHWIAPGPCEPGRTEADLNRAVEAFDVPRFLQDFEASRARWLIFTVAQNTGCYASPNRTIDRIAGPGHCSQRDLVMEIAQGVHAQGRRFIAYLPGEVSGTPESFQKAFHWNPLPETDQREFQKHYLEAITEWAVRWGRLLDGWWIDGCFNLPVLRHAHVQWADWYQALRAGNSDAALTFNDGCFCVDRETPIRPEHDYLAGEAEELIDGKIRLGREPENPEPRLHVPQSGILPGTNCRWHVLLPVDAFWMHLGKTPAWVREGLYTDPARVPRGMMEPPVYRDKNLNRLLDHAHSVGGGVTFNVGIFQDGRLSPETIAQLQRLDASAH